MAEDALVAWFIIVGSYDKRIISAVVFCTLDIAHRVTGVVAACSDDDRNMGAVFCIPFFYHRNDHVNHLFLFILIKRRSFAARAKRKQSVNSVLKLKEDILLESLVINGTVRKHWCNHCCQCATKFSHIEPHYLYKICTIVT